MADYRDRIANALGSRRQPLMGGQKDPGPVDDPSWRPMLESFSKIPMRYEPGSRESANVDDRRGEMPTENGPPSLYLSPANREQYDQLRSDRAALLEDMNDSSLGIDPREADEWLAQADAGLAEYESMSSSPPTNRRKFNRDLKRIPSLGQLDSRAILPVSSKGVDRD